MVQALQHKVEITTAFGLKKKKNPKTIIAKAGKKVSSKQYKICADMGSLTGHHLHCLHTS